MKKIVALTLAVTSISLAFVSAGYAEQAEYHKEEIKISNPDAHNATLQACMKTTLNRHPGAITEVEVESEDGKMIIDVDVQGKDGKSWEVECDAATGAVIEDKEESDDKEEADDKEETEKK
ncbi:PepSY domain-containing protein [Methylotenera sp.]|uniref:PepSY domain-containing protein n=1 Tax=Methylotenera sp. TaxID=2051956 RepID=UPI002734C6A0|nr:PepSY domain-containing protein [Methylotenera sp.]MDP3212026.1 PepSY domain-containing protein [Methylotenera sp.]